MVEENNKQINFDSWLLILQALTALGVLLIAVTIFVAYREVRDEWNLIRQDRAVNLVARTVENMQELRDPVKGSFPDMYVPGERKPLSTEEARNLYNACLTPTPEKDAATDQKVAEQEEEKSRTFSCEARKNVADLLGYHNHAAWLYNNVAADETAKEYLGRELLDDYVYFEKFIRFVKKENDKNAWQAFSGVAQEIKNEE